MKGKPETETDDSALPEARVSRKRHFTIIWLVPIIAGVIAGWLVYQNLRQAGPGITIRFTGVLSDSRCPGDAICVSAGDAVVALVSRARFAITKES